MTIDLHASKSSTMSDSWPAATLKFALSFRPLCCALGVDSAVTAPPVGWIALAVALPVPFSASTSRTWE